MKPLVPGPASAKVRLLVRVGGGAYHKGAAVDSIMIMGPIGISHDGGVDVYGN